MPRHLPAASTWLMGNSCLQSWQHRQGRGSVQAADAVNGVGTASTAEVVKGCMVPHLHRTNEECKDWQSACTSAP